MNQSRPVIARGGSRRPARVAAVNLVQVSELRVVDGADRRVYFLS